MRAMRWVAIIAIAALAFLMPVLPAQPGPLVSAGPKPPGTDPPTVDGLLDDSYVEVGPTDMPNTPGMLYSYDYLGTGADDGLCFYALVVDRAFNDNVFGPYDGTVLDGWTTNGKDGVGHHFKDLEQSDSANFQLGDDGCSFWLDYIDREDAVWCAGTCGDAWGGRSPFPQDPAGCGDDLDIVARSSAWYNLEMSVWGSPYVATITDTGAWTSPDPLNYNCITSDYYEWQMIYEFSIPRPATGCPSLSVADSHNSPSKEDKNGPGLGKIGNLVWYDENTNGLQDESGGGMFDVCMNLYKDAGGDTWELVGSTQTSPQGIYWFDYLEAGRYYVDPGGSCIPDGYCHTLSTEAQFLADNGSMPDPDDVGFPVPQCNQSSASLAMELLQDGFVIDLLAGETFTQADFGYDSSPTAVDLTAFTANQAGQAVLVEWQTATEIDNLGFNLYRAGAEDGIRVQLNDALIPTRMPPGSPVGAAYEFVDGTIELGVVYDYWLEAVDIHGQAETYGPVSAGVLTLTIDPGLWSLGTDVQEAGD